MRIQLSEHFTYKKLLLFALPTIATMLFSMIYAIVDGLFASNFVGKSAFTAINLIVPFISILGAIGFMFGAGGSALVAKAIGEGEREKANHIFSLLVCVIVSSGILCTVIGEIFLPQIAVLLGANEETYEYCMLYGRIVLGSLTFFMLQNIFQGFFVVAEKAKLGLIITVCSGLTNIILDALFVLAFKWGIVGTAVATSASQMVGSVIPIIYFLSKNNSLLRFAKPVWNIKALIRTCTNGSSEFLTTISSSVVTLLYNFQLLKLAGNDGVAAFGVITYIATIFMYIFSGYAVGCSPIISYHFGAKNELEVKNVLRKSLVIIFISGIIMTGLSEALAYPLTKIFVSSDEGLCNMTVNGLRIYVVCFLICGVNIFASAFFTALNNGFASFAISFIRTVIFQISAIMVLPIFFYLNGVWCAILVSESLAIIISIAFLVGYRKKYNYSIFKTNRSNNARTKNG